MKKSLGLLAAITAGLAIGGAVWAADSTTGSITFSVEVPKILTLTVVDNRVDFNFADKTVATDAVFDNGVYTAGYNTYSNLLSQNLEAWFGPTLNTKPKVSVLTNANTWHLDIAWANGMGSHGGSATPIPMTGRFEMKILAASNSAVPAPSAFATYTAVPLVTTGTAIVGTGGQGYSSFDLYFRLRSSMHDEFAFDGNGMVTASEQVNLTLSNP